MTQDSDFVDLAALLGPPPKVIWRRCGNQPTQAVEELLRKHVRAIEALGLDNGANFLEIS